MVEVCDTPVRTFFVELNFKNVSCEFSAVYIGLVELSSVALMRCKRTLITYTPLFAQPFRPPLDTSLLKTSRHFFSLFTSTLITTSDLSDLNITSDAIYRVAQNKIPLQTICNISATSGLILKFLEAV